MWQALVDTYDSRFSFPDGEYFINNVWEAYYLLSDDTMLVGDAWRLEAICGMLGNAYAESHMNPWAWNGSVSDGAYGLVQFHPPSYYIGGRGLDFNGYAPYVPTLPYTASPTDGQAQLLVVDSPTQTKYDASNFRKQIGRDLGWSILEWNNIQDFKICDSLEEATQAFLLFYEFPSTSLSELRTEFSNRYRYASTIWEILTGEPPVPPIPTKKSKMPLYMYTLKRYRHKKGLL